MNKRAFTLIELLVVIAIIAILAAILFPVFAQAKQAAKGAASLSNNKQTTLAVVMYEGDYDDRMPASQTWGDWNSPLWFGTAESLWRVWSWDILPYMKNADILQDPMTTANAINAGFGKSLSWAYAPQYGYNYIVLSPYYPDANWTAPWRFNGISSTSVARPSETVMLSARPGETEVNGGWWWGAGTEVTGLTVEVPDCDHIPEACNSSWGRAGFWSDYALNNRVYGAFTGQNALRKSMNGNLSFVDGHAKFLNVGAMSAGTNWSWDIPAANLVVLDKSKYLWTRD
jgi:prepilin-type N-terminal cleavage/methylation domain-containing protein/prepilin-type processing-associated H-X9-DG protein